MDWNDALGRVAAMRGEYWERAVWPLRQRDRWKTQELRTHIKKWSKVVGVVEGEGVVEWRWTSPCFAVSFAFVCRRKATASRSGSPLQGAEDESGGGKTVASMSWGRWTPPRERRPKTANGAPKGRPQWPPRRAEKGPHSHSVEG